MLSSKFLLGLAMRIQGALEASREAHASQFTEKPRYMPEGSRNDVSFVPHLLAKTVEGGTFYRKLFELLKCESISLEEFSRRIGSDPERVEALRTTRGPIPSRETVVAVALALELDSERAAELLGAAGYSFDGQEVYDLVILYCIAHKVFELREVNEALKCFNLKPIRTNLLPSKS